MPREDPDLGLHSLERVSHCPFRRRQMKVPSASHGLMSRLFSLSTAEPYGVGGLSVWSWKKGCTATG